MNPRIAVLLFLPLALAQPVVVAQSREQAREQTRAEDRQLAAAIAQSPHVYGHILNVKLREGSGAELVDGRLRSRTGEDLAAVQTLFDAARAEPLFTALSWDELDRWHARACAALPAGKGPGHLGLWFRLTTPTIEAADYLSQRLWDVESVDCVVKEAMLTPASLAALPNDIPPPTPLFTSLQQTHLPTPLGHGIWRAQGVLGARGQGVAVRMVEQEWDLDHEDVSQCVATSFIGAVPLPGGAANHGTAGASVIVADRNEYGFTGSADEASIQFVSLHTNGGVANALLLGGTSTQPGDLVLFAMMFMFGQTGPTDWVPYELLQPLFDATLTLTGNGLIVVVSAGNGDNSLDDPRFLNRFDRSYRDSGAILAAATNGALLDKASFSNYGSRIDANGWGDGVCACGAGTLFFPNNDPRQGYTTAYPGTSSAAACVAGIVPALQGAAERQLGSRLTNNQVRQAFATHGPLSPDAIGRRPDLYGIMTALGIVDGLEVGHPDVPLGGNETVTITGPAGSGCLLFASFGTGDLDLGFNRTIHLALPSMLTIGFVPMPTGTAGFQIAVPNVAGLAGVSLYVQAGVLTGSAPVHVTNSGQLTIL